MNRRWVLIALGLVVVGLAVGTLGPSPSDLLFRVAGAADDGGLDWVTYDRLEAAANVLMFVPVGFLLAAAIPRLSGWLVWAICVAGSVVVELVQTMLPGRHPSVADVLLNAAGAGVGTLLHAVPARRRETSRLPDRFGRSRRARS